MKTYAIVQDGCLVTVTEDQTEAERQSKITGREAITVVLKTKNEKKLLNALAVMVRSTVKCADGYSLAKINGTGQGDGEVVDNAKSCLNDVIGVKVF